VFNYLKSLVKIHHPKAKTMLSLACGTGALCKKISRKYQVSGLDLSPGMIEQAKKKLPKAEFFVQDMTNFETGKQYDVVTCLFASLNHVMGFDNWKQMFKQAQQHLKPDGVFIFDILSELCLYNMVLNSPIITRSGKLITVGDISSNEGGEGTIWAIKGFNVNKHGQEFLFETVVTQMSVALEQVEEALKELFEEVYVDDPEQGEVNERSELLYFVCKRPHNSLNSSD
jgi:ubiquinone/menaquinone biosynthesis C-methylase UbiE